MASRAVLLAVVLMLGACSKVEEDEPPLAVAAQRIAVGGYFRFVLREPSTLTVVEPDGGTIEEGALYRAPKVAGTFHVRIASKADPSRTTTATVKVEIPQLRLLSGVFGGRGWIDAVGDRAAFDLARPLVLDGIGHAFIGEQRHLRKVDLATRAVTTVATIDGTVTSLARDGAGTTYLTLDNSTAVWRLDPSSGKATVFAGADGDFGSVDGTLATARLSRLLLLAGDGAHTLYVADSDNRLLRRIDLSAGTVTTVAGTIEDREVVDGVGPAAAFRQTHAIAWDPTGAVWVVDEAEHRLRRFDPTTRAVKTVAMGNWSEWGFGQSIGVTDTGTVYVGAKGTLQRVDGATGAMEPVSTKGGAGMAWDGARLWMTVDGLRVWDPKTGVETNVAGATEPLGAIDGPASAARFAQPGPLFFGGGRLLASDPDNYAIRGIDPVSGAVATVLGKLGENFTRDGVGTDARFRCPNTFIDDRVGGGWMFDCDAWRHVDFATWAVTSKPDDVGDRLLHIGKDGTEFVLRPVPGGGSRVFVRGTTRALAGVHDVAGVASDDFGHLFLLEGSDATLHRITLADARDEVIAGASGAFAHVDGPPGMSRLGGARAGGFWAPLGPLVDDARGGLFFVDGATVRKIDVVTGVVSTVVGTPGVAGQVEGALPGQLFEPRSIAIGPDGALYVRQHGAVLTVATPL